MSKNTRIALIFGGFVTAIAAAFYPIFFYPYMHKREYSKCFHLFKHFIYSRGRRIMPHLMSLFAAISQFLLGLLSNHSSDKVTKLCSLVWLALKLNQYLPSVTVWKLIVNKVKVKSVFIHFFRPLWSSSPCIFNLMQLEIHIDTWK